MASDPAALVVALDIGTSRVRAAVGRPGGRLLAVAHRVQAYARPAGGPDLARDLDTGRAWALARLTVRRALRDAPALPAEIAAIAVTSQRQGIVAVDEEGETVYAGPNIDMRAAFQGAAIDERHADAVWRATGHLPSMLGAWARLRWLAEADPARARRVAHVLPIADWLTLRLTGRAGVDRALGVECGLVDVASGEPASRLARALGFDAAIIPPPRDPGTVAGTLTDRAARSLGLRGGIPVVSAGPDTQAGLYGLGVVDPGQAGVIAGWSGAVQVVTGQPRFDPARAAWTGRHVAPGRWVQEGNTGPMGRAYEWLAGLIGGPDITGTMRRLDRQLSRLLPGAGGVTAILAPALLDMSRVGLQTGGLLFPAPLALDAPGPPALARAAVESFGFTVRSNLERLEALAGETVGDVRVGGGMTRSASFARVLASVLGRRIRAGGPEATARGAVALAAWAVGLVGRRAARLRTVAPDAVEVMEYESLYREWRRLEEMLAGSGA